MRAPRITPLLQSRSSQSQSRLTSPASLLLLSLNPPIHPSASNLSDTTKHTLPDSINRRAVTTHATLIANLTRNMAFTPLMLGVLVATMALGVNAIGGANDLESYRHNMTDLLTACASDCYAIATVLVGCGDATPGLGCFCKTFKDPEVWASLHNLDDMNANDAQVSRQDMRQQVHWRLG